jgi:flavin-binding protein dodecin
MPNTDATFKIVELTGSSPDGVTEAINSGIARASETLRNLDWVEVVGIRGYIGPDAKAVTQFQVTMKVGFRLD